MNKALPLTLVALAVIGIGAFALMTTNDDDSSRNNTDSSSSQLETSASEQSSDIEAVQQAASNDANTDSETATENEGQSGAYITLADYNANPDQYANQTKVHFFHADWCPTCRGIESEINADISRIPDNVVFIKTDFDDEVELKQKYGVTVQTTFVQIDNDGTEVNQWTASNLDSAVSGISIN